jgi:hypothetical protein
VLGAAGGELCRPRAPQLLWRRAAPRRKLLRSEDVRFDAYVASECLTCFSCFEKMLQVFHDDVAKVDLDVAMLHMCIVRVASVLSECWIFHKDISSPSAGPPWPWPQSDARHPSSPAGHHFPTLATKNLPPSIFLIFLCCKCVYRCCNNVLDML